MINRIKRFFEIARERGLRDALSSAKSYLLFELPDPFFWTPLTRHIYSKYDKIGRSELRENAEITVETETEFIPFKSILGIRTNSQEVYHSELNRAASAEVPTGEKMAFYQPGDRFVTEIKEAKIKGEHGLCLNSENKIILEASGPENLQPASTINTLKQAIQELNFSFNDEPKEKIETATPLLIYYGDAYYHWTIEGMPKMFMLEKYSEKTNTYPDLLVRKDRSKFIDEYLEIIDYPGTIRYWNGGLSSIQKLVVPSYPDPTIEEIEWLREKMIERIEDENIGKKKILVTRQDADTRQIENFDEVKKELSKFGFETVTPGEHTVEEQVNIFKDAEIIVGVHGAGLTNIIYAENARIIELVGEEKNHATFSRISYVLNFDYERINCENVESNIKVNPKDVIDRL